jgi:hypothetical protein
MTRQLALELTEASREKISSLRESLRGFPGLVIPERIQHQIMISNMVIDRMKKYTSTKR